MTNQISKELEAQYRALQERINDHQRGACDAHAVKIQSAPLGIYAEKDGAYMTRVRLNGGVIAVCEISDAADIMEQNGIAHAHFSTRQNLQLHGVPGGNLYRTLADFGQQGMIFRGGGGNTFRSLTGSPYAGISPDEVFDTTPYARAVWKSIFDYDKAFAFGRKFKMGFASEPSDDTNCAIQDLGLMAVMKAGRKGFKIYGGGGLGRGGMTGFVLVPFLPAERALQAVVAAVDLFYDHGDRENRSRARLRFVRERLGPEGYRALYLDYLQKSAAPLLSDIREIDYRPSAAAVTRFQEPPPETAAYRSWLRRAVRTTKFECVSAVRLFIRKGIFKAPDLRTLAAILQSVGATEIRLTAQQDAVIPFVHQSALPVLYRALTEQLTEQAVTDGSFARHVIACVGAERCTLGLIESTAVAENVARALDELFAGYADIRDEVFEGIIDGIRVSGCGSSCSLNQIAAIGFNGHRQKIDGVLTDICQIHIGGDITEAGHYLALNRTEWWIRAEESGLFVAKLVQEYLDDYRAGNRRSLRAYMVQQREIFDFARYIC